MAAALEVFWRKGLHDATMQDISEAAGVQRGSLYNAYGDKEAIFLRAFDAYSVQFLASSAKSLTGDNFAAQLRNFLSTAIENMTSGSPHRGCLTTRTAINLDISSTAVRERVQDTLDRLERLLATCISSSSKGKRNDAKSVARLIVTFTRGLAVMERAGYTRKQLNEIAATFSQQLASAHQR